METLQRTANRGSTSTGYDIDNSLKLEEANLECINTPSSYSLITASNVYKGTTSFWIKRTSLNNGSGVQWLFNGSNSSRYDGIYWDANDKLKGYFSALGNGADFVTTQVFRDTSAWYHIVMAIDTSLSTASERIKIYVNGEQITDWDTSPSIDQNTQLTSLGTDAYHGWGTSYSYNLGVSSDGSSEYLANCIHIDGQQLTSTDFGEFDEDSGIWKPKAYTGTYGNKGYLLEFQSSSALGTDTSGNGNNFTNNRNITSADQATDTPTNNFCTLFPPPAAVTGTEPSVKEGGTTMFGGVSNTQNAFGTMGVRSGKWYFESTITNSGGVTTNNHNFGVIDPEQITYVMTSGRDIGASPAGWACASDSLPRNNNASASGANATGSLAENEIMGVAIDMDNGKIWWHRQGTWTSINSTVGDPANGTTPAFSNLLTATDNFVIPAGGFYINNGNQTRAMNFGGYAQAVFTAVGTYTDANGYGSFAYQPPSGYYALCTKNLAEYG